jgi:CheY-like chemotaxis protein
MAAQAGKILAVMSDLFFSVKINDAAKKLGMTAEFVKDKTLALEKAKRRPPLIILDLNCDAADPLDLIAQIKANPDTAGIALIGFVSHVQTELKQRAKEIGCDTVVARSAFAQNLPAILEGYLTGAQSPEAE